jgi:hypothetical protein
MATTTETSQIRATIPGALADALKDRARREGRSYSQTIALVLRAGHYALGRDLVTVPAVCSSDGMGQAT